MMKAGMMKPGMKPEGAAGMKSEGMAGEEMGEMKGYMVHIAILPDGGYSVSGPMPAGEMAGDMGEEFDNIGAALKEILKVIKENPVGGDANAQLEAGYAAR